MEALSSNESFRAGSSLLAWREVTSKLVPYLLPSPRDNANNIITQDWANITSHGTLSPHHSLQVVVLSLPSHVQWMKARSQMHAS